MRSFILYSVFLFIHLHISGQNTLGLLVNDSTAYNGLTSVTFNRSDVALINNCGEVVNYWEGSWPLKCCYLLEDGNLLKLGNAELSGGFASGGIAGALEIVDWENNLLWEHTYVKNLEYVSHHDIEALPNGNILVIAWEYHTENEAIENGRNPVTIPGNSIWCTRIAEIEPIMGTDSINTVWLWSVWDHMVQEHDSSKLNYVNDIADYPHKIDINWFDNDPDADWMHSNSVSYNSELDLIVFSARVLDEIFILDHSTSATEVKDSVGGNFGKGGDILWRWGNPQSHKLGTNADRKLFSQHGVRWIRPGMKDEGKIILFNNGVARPEGYISTIDMIDPTMNEEKTEFIFDEVEGYGPETYYKTYTPSPDSLPGFFSAIGSNADQLPNGNILVSHNMEGYVFELDSMNNTVWYYQKAVSDAPIDTFMQGTSVTLSLGIRQFMTYKYPYDYPAFTDKDLSTQGIVQHPDDPEPDSCSVIIPEDNTDTISEIDTTTYVIDTFIDGVHLYPNPVYDILHLESYTDDIMNIQIQNISGSIMDVHLMDSRNDYIQISTSDLPRGIYILKVFSTDEVAHSLKFSKL